MKITKNFATIVIIGIFLAIQCGCQEQAATPQNQNDSPMQQRMTTAAANPKIQVENPVHDFGDIGPNSRNTCQYNFKNIGDAKLVIKKIRSTCGCTVPELAKKDYQPGEEGTINVTFKSSTRKGAVTKHLYIESNDPENPKYELAIKANVKLNIDVTPSVIDLSLDKDTAQVPEITIKSLDGKSFAVKSFTCTQNVITAKFDPAYKATEIVLQPVIDYEKLKNNLRGVIRIDITHPLTNQVSLTYNAKAEFEVLSPRIIMQNAEPGQIIKKTVWITSNYGKKVETEAVTIEKGYIEILSQENNENDMKIEVQVTVPPKTGNSRYFSDTMDIKLKTGEDFKVRCNGFYKRQTD
ncbi:MAG: DUF1573 domain-containing protein [Sedimentisphaerales bacterium]|nr:DUF1573 domain-containing protein [Sedimentisphaerales bacterium]